VHLELKTLLELQQLDERLFRLRSRISDSPLEIQTLKAQLDEFVHAMDGRKTRLAANQKERRELEGDVQEIRSKITRHKDQLYQVKTNEQYRAMLKEIESEEAKIRMIEDSILEKMIESEQIDKLIREAMVRLDSERKRVDGAVAKLESDRTEAERLREQEETHRRALAASLSKATYALYEKLSKARNGLALAEVRDGFCGGCHVRLRPQAYNDVCTKEALVTCDACSRILYCTEPSAEETSAEGVASGRRAAV
jgi:uncharacterized protein